MNRITSAPVPGEPASIRTAAATVAVGSRELEAIRDRLVGLAHLGGWEGVAADAARADVGAVVRGLLDSVADADAIRLALETAADDLDPLWTLLRTGDPVAALSRWWAAEDLLIARLGAIDPDTDTLDGLSAADRDAVNRRRVVSERARLEAVASELRESLRDNVFGGLFSNADAGLEQTEKRLQALDAIEAVLARGDRQLLVLDNSGEKETMAVIAVGDVDSAANVAVFVPGLGSTVQGSIEKYDTEVAGIVDPADAGITWLGYETPQLGWGLLDPDTSVLSGRAADVAGERLASFLDELPTDRHVTVVGHSYGSVAVADALTSDTRVDDVVLMGSPGTGVSTAADLNAEHVYVLESPTDVVADAAWFGRDPNLVPGVQVLASGGADGHGQYLDAGTASAANVAAVVARTPTTSARVPVDAGDLLRVVLGLAF